MHNDWSRPRLYTAFGLASMLTLTGQSAAAANADALTAVDMNTGLSNSNWTFRLFAKNLTDKRAYLTAFSFPDLSGANIVQNEATVLQPRTIGLAVDYKF